MTQKKSRPAKGTQPHPVDPKQVRAFLHNAHRKLTAAKRTVAIDEEAAHEITYGAMLKATIALLLSTGQRLRSGPGHHEAAIQFAESYLGTQHQDLVSAFRRMKRKRNSTFYDVVPTTRTEAEEAVVLAERYLKLLTGLIEQNLPSR